MKRLLHVGIVSEPVPGHLNRALSVGRELRGRGHRVTVFGIADLEQTVAASGLELCVVGRHDFPKGSLTRLWVSPRWTRGPLALLDTIRLHTRETEMLCRDVPGEARRRDVDALIVDQLQVCGPYLAETVGVPFFTMCAGPGVVVAADGSFPPPFVPWAPSTALPRRLMNRAGFAGLELVGAPRLRVANRYARRDGVRPRRRVVETSSPVLHISMLVPELNFSYEPSPSDPYRHFGPLIDERRPPTDFPWDRLDGRPLVYASLGTGQDKADDLYAIIAAACAGLHVQLVLTLGDERGGRPRPVLEGDPIVVHHAPQLDLLRRAALCITHCGMNTTMECAAFGVPVVGIPIIYDQPAVAARIRHAGMGETIPYKRLDVAGLRRAVAAVLTEPAYRSRAARIAESCRAHGGPAAAADEIERLTPVTASTPT